MNNIKDNPLYKVSTTPYQENKEYQLLIQPDYNSQDRPPPQRWVKAKYLVDSQGVGSFVSVFLPKNDSYDVIEVWEKDVSLEILADISFGLFCEDVGDWFTKQDYIDVILGVSDSKVIIEREKAEAVHYHKGFLRGLKFAGFL